MTQSQIDPPVTAARASRRSQSRKRRVPLALVLVPVVLVAVGAVLLLVLGGGTDALPIIGGNDEEPSNEVPAFDFRPAKVGAVPTAEGVESESLRPQAQAAAQAVTPVLDDLYTNAFLDPTNWREGDYAEVLELFTPGAAASAEGALATLTLGVDAGDVYRAVTPQRGSLKYSVLFDPEGNADTVVVTVRFVGLGERQDDTWVTIVSSGTVFLRNEGGWTITAFDLSRNDKETRAPTPSPTAGATGATGATR